MNKKPEKQNQITAKSKTVPKYSAIAEHHCERKKKKKQEEKPLGKACNFKQNEKEDRS